MTMMTPPAEKDAEFNDWVNTEHLPERRDIDGFVNVRRFRNSHASPRYMAMYDLVNLSVLQSSAYRKIAGDNLSPWSKRMLMHATDRWRFEGTLIEEYKPASVMQQTDQGVELLVVIAKGLTPMLARNVAHDVRSALAHEHTVLRWRFFSAVSDGLEDYVAILEFPVAVPSAVLDVIQCVITASVPDARAHLFTLI